jgi:hypothetical protein
MEIEIGNHPDRLTSMQCARLATDRHDWTVAVSDGRAWAYVHAW